MDLFQVVPGYYSKMDEAFDMLPEEYLIYQKV